MRRLLDSDVLEPSLENCGPLNSCNMNSCTIIILIYKCVCRVYSKNLMEKVRACRSQYSVVYKYNLVMKQTKQELIIFKPSLCKPVCMTVTMFFLFSKGYWCLTYLNCYLFTCPLSSASKLFTYFLYIKPSKIRILVLNFNTSEAVSLKKVIKVAIICNVITCTLSKVITQSLGGRLYT